MPPAPSFPACWVQDRSKSRYARDMCFSISRTKACGSRVGFDGFSGTYMCFLLSCIPRSPERYLRTRHAKCSKLEKNYCVSKYHKSIVSDCFVRGRRVQDSVSESAGDPREETSRSMSRPAPRILSRHRQTRCQLPTPTKGNWRRLDFSRPKGPGPHI